MEILETTNDPIEVNFMKDAMSSVKTYLEIVKQNIDSERNGLHSKGLARLYFGVLKVHYRMFVLYYNQAEDYLDEKTTKEAVGVFEQYRKISDYLNSNET